MSERFELTSKPEQLSPVLSYLAAKNKALKNNYKDVHGEYSESCTLIASDVADLLLKEGKHPYIMRIRGKHTAESDARLIPSPFEGRIEWGAHIVCVCECLVYDPIVLEPMPVEEYMNQVFNGEGELETAVAEDKTAEWVKK